MHAIGQAVYKRVVQARAQATRSANIADLIYLWKQPNYGKLANNVTLILITSRTNF